MNVRTRAAMMTAAVLACGLGACGGSGHGGTGEGAKRPAGAQRYTSARVLIRALAAHGAPCESVQVLSAPSSPGATSLADCSGKSDGDTSIGTFDGHASAVAFAARLISSGVGSGAEVVGPDWVVNTSRAYASSVRTAIGGQMFTSEDPPPAAAASSSSTPAAPGPVSPTRVRFVVTGSAPDGASIDYGSDSDDITVPGSLGFDGSGVAVPWHGSVRFDGGALYYVITAQLQGSGDIKCKIITTGPGDAPLTVSHGHASGGYSICRAQAAPSDPSGLSWQNEN